MMPDYTFPSIDKFIEDFGAQRTLPEAGLKETERYAEGLREASVSMEFNLTDEQVDTFTDILQDPEWPTVIK